MLILTPICEVTAVGAADVRRAHLMALDYLLVTSRDLILQMCAQVEHMPSPDCDEAVQARAEIRLRQLEHCEMTLALGAAQKFSIWTWGFPLSSW